MVSRQLLTFCLCCLALCLPGLATAAASASADRTAINIDETFQLTISLDSTAFFSDPDTTPLEKDFTLLGRQQSSQSTIVNGKRSSQTQWIYQLAPKKIGVFTIPALEVDGDKTQPLTIKVSGSQASNAAADSSKPVFMEASIDKQQVYVQEQLVFTLRINTAINLQNLELLQKPEIPNAIMVETSNTHYERSINGMRYITYEIVYAVFPQARGTLTIPALEAQGINPGRNSFNSFFGGGQQVRLQSSPLTVDVLPAPEAAGNAEWLPAKNLILRETWSADPENLQVGDSITRTIVTSADGLGGDQLPQITIAANGQFKTYADQPVFNDTKTNQGLAGERKDSITLVLTQPGNITLPAISIPWWDISTGTMQTASLPAVTLKVQGTGSGTAATQAPLPPPAVMPPAAVIPDNPQPADATSHTAPVPADTSRLLAWQIATAISSALAVLFLSILLMQNRKKPAAMSAAPAVSQSSAAKALATLKNACQAGKPGDIRRDLLAWAQLNWPDARIHSTSDIALLCRDEELRNWLNRLDAYLYAVDRQPGGHNDNWPDFYHYLEQHHSREAASKTDLQPLYPG